MIQTPRVGPGRGWYGIAAAVLVVGLLLAGLLLTRGVRKLLSLDDMFVRAVMPGEAAFSLPRSGEYTLFHEYRSVVDGTAYSNPQDAHGLQCGLFSAATGEQVPLSSKASSVSYSIGSYSGVSMAGFTVGQAGMYRLSCAYPGSNRGQQVVMAVGQGDRFISGIFSILGAVGAGLLSILIAAIIFGVTLSRRRKAGRAPQPGSMPYPPGYGPPPPGYAPPPGYGPPPPGYAPPPAGYGPPPAGYGPPPPGYAPPPGHGPPPPGFEPPGR